MFIRFIKQTNYLIQDISEQLGDKTCGYFIMLYMREIVLDKNQDWSKKVISCIDQFVSYITQSVGSICYVFCRPCSGWQGEMHITPWRMLMLFGKSGQSMFLRLQITSSYSVWFHLVLFWRYKASINLPIDLCICPNYVVLFCCVTMLDYIYMRQLNIMKVLFVNLLWPS